MFILVTLGIVQCLAPISPSMGFLLAVTFPINRCLGINFLQNNDISERIISTRCLKERTCRNQKERFKIKITAWQYVSSRTPTPPPRFNWQRIRSPHTHSHTRTHNTPPVVPCSRGFHPSILFIYLLCAGFLAQNAS